jgi:hypothetical protein
MACFLYHTYHRESIYRLLPQTTPENLAKNFDLYTIDPGSRYPNKNFSSVKAKQVMLHFTPLFSLT